MRIISGVAKGKKIKLPVNKKTRQLKDMVRESIFNIIEHSNLVELGLDKSYVLDLFSGVGSFGLEAISRGVKKVFFFENYKPASELLKKNLYNLSFTNKAKICTGDVYDKKNLTNLNIKFNIVFLDPPFKDEKINLILENLFVLDLLNNKNLIIIHRHKKSKDNFDDRFQIIREEIYGSSKIIFGLFNF